ncbi:hypothetical protein [Tropicimonas isoalkanivorans]|uniref:Lipoprotein n=1 Tax=Tropicimonas isoalkanivorans TaxID=441112 RepID=A0A1I1DT13_9RHOB|nr:hypothetical protein [Tropicimonas isoalkanivorans]SFB75860.1 hypothetical protein SAMN04488094_101330 [Tropicimonas isoalkanivorans]
MGRQTVGVALAIAALAGCADGAPAPRESAPFAPVYRGIETRLLDDDLVSFIVEMEGARDTQDVQDYTACAAAQYALIRGYGFARHVRTRLAQDSGVWRADAVYTVSPALPEGAQTIDAEVAVADCAERGIPTV